MGIKIGEFFENFADVARNLIEKYETEYKNLSGPKRMDRLNDAMTGYAMTVIDNIDINIILKLIIKNLIIKNIPILTQTIFNLIKTKIEGITK